MVHRGSMTPTHLCAAVQASSGDIGTQTFSSYVRFPKRYHTFYKAYAPYTPHLWATAEYMYMVSKKHANIFCECLFGICLAGKYLDTLFLKVVKSIV